MAQVQQPIIVLAVVACLMLLVTADTLIIDAASSQNGVSRVQRSTMQQQQQQPDSRNAQLGADFEPILTDKLNNHDRYRPAELNELLGEFSDFTNSVGTNTNTLIKGDESLINKGDNTDSFYETGSYEIPDFVEDDDFHNLNDGDSLFPSSHVPFLSPYSSVKELQKNFQKHDPEFYDFPIQFVPPDDIWLDTGNKRAAPKFVGRRDLSSVIDNLGSEVHQDNYLHEITGDSGLSSVVKETENKVELDEKTNGTSYFVKQKAVVEKQVQTLASLDNEKMSLADKRAAPKFVGKRVSELDQNTHYDSTKMAAKFVSRRRAPKFVGKRDPYEIYGKSALCLNYPCKDVSLVDEKRGSPKFVGKRGTSVLLGDVNELGLAEDGPLVSEERRAAPKFVGKRRAPYFVGKRGPPRFVGKRGPPRFVGKRGPPRFVGKRGPPRFVGKRGPPRFVGKRGPPRFVGKRGPPRFVGKRVNFDTFAEENSLPDILKKTANTLVSSAAGELHVASTAKPGDTDFKTPWLVRFAPHQGQGDLTDKHLVEDAEDTTQLILVSDKNEGTNEHERSKRFSEFVGKREDAAETGVLTAEVYPNQLNALYSGHRKSEGAESRSYKFLGKKRYDFLGKRYDFLGKRYDFLGKRQPYDFIGKRSYDFVGKRSYDFVGKRAPYDFVGKRAPYDFVGKRAPYGFVDKRDQENVDSENLENNNIPNVAAELPNKFSANSRVLSFNKEGFEGGSKRYTEFLGKKKRAEEEEGEIMSDSHRLAEILQDNQFRKRLSRMLLTQKFAEQYPEFIGK